MDALLLVLRYGLLALLYLFLWQVLRIVGRDVTAATTRKTTDQAEEPGLVIEAGEQVLGRPVGDWIPIGPGLTLGRQQDVDLPIASKFASARHAALRPTDRGWVLEDLASTNGTILNGTIIRKPEILRDGDHILIGEAAFTFRLRRS